MITDDVKNFWDNIGTFWSDFRDRELFNHLWEEYKNLCKEMQRRNAQAFLSQYFEHMPNIFEYRKESFLYEEGDDKIYPEKNFIFSIPSMKGVETEENLVEDTDYEITENGRINIINPPSTQNRQVKLYAENIYAYNPVLWRVFGESIGMDVDIMKNRDYNLYRDLPNDDINKERSINNHFKFLIWSLYLIKRSTPNIKNLKKGLGISRGLPFSYESGVVEDVSNRVITIGNYTYDIPDKFTIDVSVGEEVEKFQLLVDEITYEENFGDEIQKMSKVKFTLSNTGAYNSSFSNNYFQSIMPKGLDYTIIEE